jgi:hypothetical protein
VKIVSILLLGRKIKKVAYAGLKIGIYRVRDQQFLPACLTESGN